MVLGPLELQRLAEWVHQLTTEQLAATLAMCEVELDRRRTAEPRTGTWVRAADFESPSAEP